MDHLTRWHGTRDQLVAAARDSIDRGSSSFAAASRALGRTTRERVWLLYAWCRAADDLTDGQDGGRDAGAASDTAGQAELERLTWMALDTDAPVPLPFAALRQVAREVPLERRVVADHLSGFALDVAGWRPQTTADLLDYCYRVAGAVGALMAGVLGAPNERDTLDRACDLGIAFQLANIARDIVPDSREGRVYVPAEWLAAAGVSGAALADPAHRAACAGFAARLVALAESYRASARVGASRLPLRARWAVLAAERVYGAIGERVAAQGAAAWDARVFVPDAEKRRMIAGALGAALVNRPPPAPRDGLWTRPSG